MSHNYGTSPFSMGKPTISMAIFNGYVTNYQRVHSLRVVGLALGDAFCDFKMFKFRTHVPENLMP